MPGITHIHQCLAPVSAQLLVVASVEVSVRLVTLVGATVGSLQGEGVGDPHVPEHNSPRGLLGSGHGEATILEVEAIFCILVEHQRKKLFHQILLTSFSKIVKVNFCI